VQNILIDGIITDFEGSRIVPIPPQDFSGVIHSKLKRTGVLNLEAHTLLQFLHFPGPTKTQKSIGNCLDASEAFKGREFLRSAEKRNANFSGYGKGQRYLRSNVSDEVSNPSNLKTMR